MWSRVLILTFFLLTMLHLGASFLYLRHQTQVENAYVKGRDMQQDWPCALPRETKIAVCREILASYIFSDVLQLTYNKRYERKGHKFECERRPLWLVSKEHVFTEGFRGFQNMIMCPVCSKYTKTCFMVNGIADMDRQVFTRRTFNNDERSANMSFEEMVTSRETYDYQSMEYMDANEKFTSSQETRYTDVTQKFHSGQLSSSLEHFGSAQRGDSGQWGNSSQGANSSQGSANSRRRNFRQRPQPRQRFANTSNHSNSAFPFDSEQSHQTIPEETLDDMQEIDIDQIIHGTHPRDVTTNHKDVLGQETQMKTSSSDWIIDVKPLETDNLGTQVSSLSNNHPEEQIASKKDTESLVHAPNEAEHVSEQAADLQPESFMVKTLDVDQDIDREHPVHTANFSDTLKQLVFTRDRNINQLDHTRQTSDTPEKDDDLPNIAPEQMSPSEKDTDINQQVYAIHPSDGEPINPLHEIELGQENMKISDITKTMDAISLQTGYDKPGMQVGSLLRDGSEKNIANEKNIESLHIPNEAEQPVSDIHPRNPSNVEPTNIFHEVELGQEGMKTSDIAKTMDTKSLQTRHDKPGMQVGSLLRDGSEKNIANENNIESLHSSNEAEQPVSEHMADHQHESFAAETPEVDQNTIELPVHPAYPNDTIEQPVSDKDTDINHHYHIGLPSNTIEKANSSQNIASEQLVVTKMVQPDERDTDIDQIQVIHPSDTLPNLLHEDKLGPEVDLKTSDAERTIDIQILQTDHNKPALQSSLPKEDLEEQVTTGGNIEALVHTPNEAEQSVSDQIDLEQKSFVVKGQEVDQNPVHTAHPNDTAKEPVSDQDAEPSDTIEKADGSQNVAPEQQVIAKIIPLDETDADDQHAPNDTEEKPNLEVKNEPHQPPVAPKTALAEGGLETAKSLQNNAEEQLNTDQPVDLQQTDNVIEKADSPAEDPEQYANPGEELEEYYFSVDPMRPQSVFIYTWFKKGGYFTLYMHIIKLDTPLRKPQVPKPKAVEPFDMWAGAPHARPISPYERYEFLDERKKNKVPSLVNNLNRSIEMDQFV